MPNILILGGGAAGLAAALAAAQSAPAAQVIVLERNPKPGKKLLATGNGRCNLDNTGIAPELYFTADPAALRPLLDAVNTADPLRWFRALGLYTRTDEAGRVYGIRCVQVAWKGRKPVARPGTEFFRKADLVLLAMGFTGPEQGTPSAEGLPNVWAAGDMVTGPSLVVWAGARGHEVARQIAAHLAVPAPV